MSSVSKPKSQPPTGWTGLLIAILAITVMLFLQTRKHQAEKDWAVVQVTVHRAEILPDHVIERRGANVTWRADYPITYAANGREYKQRVDSGIRGESKDEIERALPKALPTCTVRYRPETPEVSVAECH